MILMCKGCLHLLPHKYTKKGNWICTRCSNPNKEMI